MSAIVIVIIVVPFVVAVFAISLCVAAGRSER